MATISFISRQRRTNPNRIVPPKKIKREGKGPNFGIPTAFIVRIKRKKRAT